MDINERLARFGGCKVYSKAMGWDKDGGPTWLFCGCEDMDSQLLHELPGSYYPHLLVNLTESLDALFEWIVPENAEVEIRENLIGQFTSVKVKTRDGKSGMGVTRWGEESDRLKRTAASLCRAIEQLMDKERQEEQSDEN